MEARKLEALITSVELGSFNKAAKVLGYTQSGLTHMMNALERELGFSVLERNNYGVKLTENGRQLLEAAREFVRAERELQEQIRGINAASGQTLQIGAYASIAAHWLPAVIKAFTKERPQMTVEIRMGTVEQLRSWLEKGAVDLVFGSDVGCWQQWIPLGTDPFVAVLPPDYQPDREDFFPIEQFNHKEFIMPADGFDLDIIRELRKHEVTPRFKSTQVDDPAVLSMVEHSLGITIMTRLVLKGDTHRVRVIPIAPEMHRELGIALPSAKKPPVPVRQFIDCAQRLSLSVE